MGITTPSRCSVQVLCTSTDLVIIDFKGESTRPLCERRLKRPALEDIAGMLRSFHYAVRVASADIESRVETSLAVLG
jgi:maltose alpha-D-glucosyltransferase / alpha-amylase